MAAETLKFKTEVDATGFEAGTNRLEKIGAAAAARLQKTLGGVFGNLTPEGAVIKSLNLTSAAMDKIRAGVLRTFDTGQRFSQLSRQTGASVAGLVVLDSKFKQAGLSSDQLGGTLAKLERALAGVEDDETKGAGAAITRLGLNMAQLRKDSPDRALFAVGAALGQMSDPAARTAAAMTIFGKAGAELGAVFNSSGFTRISPELQRRADLFAHNAAAFEQANRSLQRVGHIVAASAETFYAGVASGLVSGLQPLLDDFKSADFSSEGKDFGRALGDGATAIHNMLGEIKNSGLIELGQKVAAALSNTVQGAGQVIGDAAKLSGIPGLSAGRGPGALQLMSAAASGVMDGTKSTFGPGLAAAHAFAHLDEIVRARITAKLDERYAERHNNPADPGVASTNHRPETRATNSRPLTLPAARAPLTLPDPTKRLKPSAPGGAYTEADLYEMDYRRRQAAAAAAPQISANSAAADRVVITGQSDDIGAAMDRTNARFRATHRMGQTMLDADPSKRPGWTGARDAFAGLRAADPKDLAEVRWAALERFNYFGTSGNGYGGHTGLTSGGLGGGAYGRTGNIWTQLSGRTGGGDKDHGAEIAKNTAGILASFNAAWHGTGGGSSSGVGATVTG